MPNTFIVPSIIARLGIATLYNTIVLAGLVWRDFDADFTGKQGDTITVRKPAVFTAETFDQTARTTTWQDATEDSVPIQLDTLKHVPFHVTDEQMTLDIVDFQAQLLNPAMEALAQGIDADLAEELVVAAQTHVTSAPAGGGARLASKGVSDPANKAYRDARRILSRNKLPTNERYAVLSPEGVSETLSDELLVKVNESGTTDALREAILGRIYGIDTYESQVYGVGGGKRGVADGVVFHRSSVVLAARPLQAPRGVPAQQVSVANYKSLSLRTIYSYDPEAKMDQVVIDMLYGLKATRPEGAVELDFGQGS